MSDRFLDGRTALVTGATSGIGLAIALRAGCAPARRSPSTASAHAIKIAAALASVDAARRAARRAISTPTCATPARSKR